jgi:hypothetical protein
MREQKLALKKVLKDPYLSFFDTTIAVFIEPDIKCSILAMFLKTYNIQDKN